MNNTGRTPGNGKKPAWMIWWTAAALLCTLCLTGCGRLTAVAVQSGILESPYYHLGDTEWDHGGVEEYWFNQIPSEMNETYRELYERLVNNEDEANMYARMDADNFWKVYYAVLADHPEIFWLGEVDEEAVTGGSISYTDISGKLYANMRHEILNEPGHAIVFEELLDFIES